MVKSDILSDVWWLFFIERIYGFHAFKLERNARGGKYFLPQKWYYILFTIFQTFIHISGYVLLRDYCKYIYGITNGGFFFLLTMSSRFVLVLVTMTLCIYYNVHKRHGQMFWQRIHEVENNLRKLKVEINHKLLRNVTGLSVLCTTLFTYSINVYYTVYYRSDVTISFRLLMHVYYHYIILTYILFILKHIVSLTVINEMFGTLEVAAKKKFLNVDEHTNPKCAELLEIAQCHKKICNIARLGSKIMSIPLVCELLHTFTVLTAMSFTSTATIMNNVYGPDDIANIPWVILCLLTLTTVIAAAHNCMEKVSNNPSYSKGKYAIG